MPELRRHALTVDVEDYFHVTAFEDCITRQAWSTLESRVERNTARLLELFARHGARGTFFVLGWVALRLPQVVREIQTSGHEIASHGFWHQRVYHQTPEEFRADVRRSKHLLENLTGQPVTMYRAPTFSITARSLWALDILVEEGFSLDASIFPIRHDRYGIPTAKTGLHRLQTPSGSLWEFPPTVAEIYGWRLPAGGGGYFRILPWSCTRALWRHCQRQCDGPLMFYLHPWEVDPDQPHVAGARRVNQWRHRINLASTQRKLAAMLSEFRFAAIGDLLPTAPAVDDRTTSLPPKSPNTEPIAELTP